MSKPTKLDTKQHIHQLLDNYDNFLFDCDGVIWLDEVLIPGVLDTINFLQAQGKRVAFISNNSSKSRQEYVEKFDKLGFKNITIDIIYPTCYAAALTVKEELQIPAGSKVWVLGDHGIEEELRQQGYIPVGGSDPALDTEFDLDHQLLQVDPHVKAVVVGSTKKFNYMRIATTLQYLLHQNKSLPFIGTNIDRSYPGHGGLVLPAGGSVVNYMEYTANREFINVGKPSPLLLDTVLKHQGFERDRTVMVGDTLYTDIKFGNDGKLGGGNGGSLLVLSGGTKHHDLEELHTLDQSMVPSFIMDSIGELVHFIDN
ncbi:4-nitrophenylphosphatase [Yamadazyma tenuis]|uniref:4-nitrophenylphosphatase n=1 Tax=Candida tenuis (strain ATCC 10573 / BCRC 21748 / CBS 615 / JCM 9827 / NBRC 10315 / NRRL Y-1498 / VKM Y-70) TaxID=590646 RepID=G3AZU6_CANTC|nr:p-Nitrophenyl phosphatase [Yamadazyma tenuis ATCC 10573]EGV65242.1 p-Nitrophenyl phosphatase [Yamadazyma tenuis ATCC 10573]WEJ95104.1 4-nitrophenylphosphatase [Yamadazyma tenuis]